MRCRDWLDRDRAIPGTEEAVGERGDVGMADPLAQLLLHEEARVSRREVVDLSEHPIAETLVEPSRLEVERVEQRVVTTTAHGFGLGSAHERVAVTPPSYRAVEPQLRHLEPSPHGGADEAPQNPACFVAQDHTQHAMVARLDPALDRVLDQPALDLLERLRVRRLGDFDATRHGSDGIVVPQFDEMATRVEDVERFPG